MFVILLGIITLHTCMATSVEEICSGGTFINSGANRGDNFERFISGGYQVIIDDVTGNKTNIHKDPRSFCIHLFEAHPNWQSKLHEVTEKQRANFTDYGGKINLNVPMALVGPKGPKSVQFSSKSSMSSHVSKEGTSNQDTIDVPSINFIEFFRKTVPERNTKNGALNILALDVEGVEYDIIPALISSGLACSRLDVLIIEWHGNKRTTAPRKPRHSELTYEFMLTECGVQVYAQLYPPDKIKHGKGHPSGAIHKRMGFSFDDNEAYLEDTKITDKSDTSSSKGLRVKGLTEEYNKIVIWEV